ncbi:MAG TPA: M1 family metallopeptidase [Anaerolineales bacterium]
MKRLLGFLISLSVLLASCSVPSPLTPSPSAPSPTATPALSPGSDPFQIPWEDRSIFRSGLIASEHSVLDELDGASVYHIEFDLEDNLFQVKGMEEVRYTNTETTQLSEVQFRLFPNTLGGQMTVNTLTVDGQSVDPRYELENSLMIVPLPSPLASGQSVVFWMDFFVTVPQTLESNYGVLAYAEDVLTLAHAYPMIAVYDDEGWNAEIPSENGDVTYADMSFFIVRVTAPKDVTVITSGREISHIEAGDSQTLVSAAGPARDFYLVASPHYEELSQTFGEVTIRSYAPQQFGEGSRMALDVTARAIEDFNARYAPYPYTELDIVSTPTLALGIEYPGMIAITSRIYEVDEDYRGTPASVYLESTVAHEVGHQWFYNLVGGDQLDDPWLDEALTQFATLQYYADEYGAGGEQGYRSSLEGRWDAIDRADIPIGLPVAEYSGQEYGAIVYGRGPLFFVALRERMGTQTFDAFLKNYTETLSWGIATPEVLQSLAEDHCACDLDDMFNEWVYP